MNNNTINSDTELFHRIRLERVSEKVARQLKDVISNGVLRVGDKLPPERELAEQMGVSRPSIREAIQVLAAQGILETVHGGGTIVRNLTEQQIVTPIEVIIKEDRLRALELTEVRSFMEAWAARQAAHYRTEEELAKIHSYLEEMERDFVKGQIRSDIDFAFHTEIAAATHNTVYMHIIHNIYELINYSIKIHREQVFTSSEAQRNILDHHRQIFSQIQDGNPDGAEAAMKAHLMFVVSEFKKWASL
jgi:GntR family transcriptional repressor for pyruvate dehydrogenase complex